MTDNLLTEDGYVYLENCIPKELIDGINSKLDTLVPDRAVNDTFSHATGEDIDSLPYVCVWWSKPITDWPEVTAISEILLKEISKELENPILYVSSIVTTNAGGQWGIPHVDIPHRFERWKSDRRLLGIQCVIALQDTNKENGVTAIVPKSHLQDWGMDLEHWHGLIHNEYFLENCIQLDMAKGSVLAYNCRILHRAMPNNSPNSRPMLLLTYLNGDIVEDVKNTQELEWTYDG